VGALTETEFRFDTRVYRLNTVDSICAGCATGCHVELHTYGGEVRRTVPRYAKEVNRWWMCDDGRYVFDEFQREDRADRALVDGKAVSLDEALFTAGKILQQVSGDEIIVLASARASTETLFVLQRLAKALGDVQVFGTARPDWEGDEILRSADRNPNSAGLRLVFGDKLASPADLDQRLSSGSAKVALCVDEKVTNPELADRVDTIIALVHRNAGIAKQAKVVLPMAAWCEIDGTFVNAKSQVGRFHPAQVAPGDARPGWALALGLAKAAGKSLRQAETAADVYRAASEALGEDKLPPEAFGPTRPPVLLRYANSRG
jgi:NADH-quinone oxidoreductase subunit G